MLRTAAAAMSRVHDAGAGAGDAGVGRGGANGGDAIGRLELGIDGVVGVALEGSLTTTTAVGVVGGCGRSGGGGGGGLHLQASTHR